MKTLEGNINKVIEWEYHSSIQYNDPFNALELDVYITAPSGKTWTVPTFWKAKNIWAIRFIAEEAGNYHTITYCTDMKNLSLHKIEKQLTLQQTSKTSPILKLSLSQDKSYLQTKEGKPFFWLADTWWMGLSQRLSYPQDFHTLTQDRKEKGFSVIQLVAGLFPDMNDFDTRASNEAGLVWEKEYTRINPSYFDKADERIIHLVNQDIVPCILGAWGYYIHSLGLKKMKQHWRYIIARWGVYAPVWCIAGEGAMPYYLSTNGPKDRDKQIKAWTSIGTYIKKTDPFENLITIHPTDSGRTQVSHSSVLDFNMLQAGHSGYPSVENAMRLIDEDKKIQPSMPVVMSEVNYEGIMHDTSAEVQRLTFWNSILAGAVGFSYGANGIWQVNTPKTPFGASPHGGTWGNTPWNEAMILQGSKHLGLAKKLLERYKWWNIKPYQRWISPEHSSYDYKAPRISGIPRTLRIVYFYGPIHPWSEPKYYIEEIEDNVRYKAIFWDPRSAKQHLIGLVKPDKEHRWKIPVLPTFEDWILILEATDEELPLAPFEVPIPLYKSTLQNVKKILRKIKKHI